MAVRARALGAIVSTAVLARALGAIVSTAVLARALGAIVSAAVLARALDDERDEIKRRPYPWPPLLAGAP